MGEKVLVCPIYRICILGPSEVGKTAIVNRLVNNYFTTICEPTQHDLKPYYYLMNLTESK